MMGPGVQGGGNEGGRTPQRGYYSKGGGYWSFPILVCLFVYSMVIVYTVHCTIISSANIHYK